jgi:hypothetical protein
MSQTQIPPLLPTCVKSSCPFRSIQLHGWTHFVGLYAAEHVAATEFVIGATFVALGASTMDIVVGIADRQCPGDFELDPHYRADCGRYAP